MIALRYAADRLTAEGKMSGAVRWLRTLADRSDGGQLDATLLAHAREVARYGPGEGLEYARLTLRAHALRHAARRLDAASEYPAASKLLMKISEGNSP